MAIVIFLEPTHQDLLSGRLTRRILSVKYQHLIQGPTSLRNQLLALHVVSSPSLPSHQHSIIEEYEPTRMIYSVRRRVQSKDTVHLGDHMATWGGWDKLCRSFDLGVQVLHLVRVEDFQIGY